MTSTDTRIDPPRTGGELDQLNAFLDYLRGTVVRKTHGLSEEDAHRVLLPSELMTVAGLLSHLRWVEAWWFDVVLNGQPDRAPYTDEDPDREFRIAADMTVARLVDDYEAQCAVSREIVGGLPLDHVATYLDGKQVNVRWVIIHMIEETARHAGHLDIIREQLDGATGE
ncbi:MAG TPA: DinB family protein [Actinokineospora sp.]|nr:DinB family protein [Actinokineospora sp.]